MRIAIITQEEPFYLPAFMELLLSKIGDKVVLVVGLNSIPPGESRLGMIKKFMILWGPLMLFSNMVRYLWYRLCDIPPLCSRASIHSHRRLCRRLAIPYAAPSSIRDKDFMERIKSLAPDLIVSVAANQIFHKELLALPSRGCINLHAGLLPRYRGINPTFWALANGETQTGVTVHFMEDKLDSGDIVIQKKIAILPVDTLHGLYMKEMRIGAAALCEAIDYFEHGEAPRLPNDPDQATYYSYPTREAVKSFKKIGKRFH